MSEEILSFEAELSTMGNMGLEEMSEDELKELIERECNIPTDSIKNVEVR